MKVLSGPQDNAVRKGANLQVLSRAQGSIGAALTFTEAGQSASLSSSAGKLTAESSGPDGPAALTPERPQEPQAGNTVLEN